MDTASTGDTSGAPGGSDSFSVARTLGRMEEKLDRLFNENQQVWEYHQSIESRLSAVEDVQTRQRARYGVVGAIVGTGITISAAVIAAGKDVWKVVT